MGMPKYVPYTEKFNKVIRRLVEAGLPAKWKTDTILRRKAEIIKEQQTLRSKVRDSILYNMNIS